MINKFVAFMVLSILVLSGYSAKSDINVKIIVRSFKSDELKVFYKTDAKERYDGENSKTVKFSGNNTIDTLILNLPLNKLEGIRIDFGLIPNRFEVRSIEIIDGPTRVIWQGQEIINGFIPNSNISIIDSNQLLSFNTRTFNNRFDPNMVISKNGINKIAFHLNHSDKIISSSFKFIASSKSDRLCYFWYVPEIIQKENFYLLPNKVSFFIKKNIVSDTINVNIYSEGYVAAFSLDFEKGDSSYVFINKLIFEDPIRHFDWLPRQIDNEFSQNNNIKKTLVHNVLRLDFIDDQGYVGPRIKYKFDMLNLSYMVNSFEVKVGNFKVLINYYLILIVLFALILIPINRRMLLKGLPNSFGS